MGFLDHSTNNIIIDAVLTDAGREKLAAGSGLGITQFSLGDDEVDYSIIEQYGRTVGKEKIVKNTPILEAQTDSNLAIKYKLLSLVDTNAKYLPTLTVVGSLKGSTFNITLSNKGTTNAKTASVKVTETIPGNVAIPPGASDTTYTVVASDRFLTVNDGIYSYRTESTMIAGYTVVGTAANVVGAPPEASFTLTLKPIDDTTFIVFGNGSTIKTVVTVIGDQTGLRTDFQVTITN